MGTAPPPWFLELELDTVGLNVGELRRRVVAALRQCPAGKSVDVDAAEAILGELLANVVMHAPGSFGVRLGLGADGSAVLEVSDCGAPFPYPAPSRDPREPGGHGLRLAAVLSRDLHVSHQPGRGNVIVAVLAAKP